MAIYERRQIVERVVNTPQPLRVVVIFPTVHIPEEQIDADSSFPRSLIAIIFFCEARRRASCVDDEQCETKFSAILTCMQLVWCCRYFGMRDNYWR